MVIDICEHFCSSQVPIYSWCIRAGILRAEPSWAGKFPSWAEPSWQVSELSWAELAISRTRAKSKLELLTKLSYFSMIMHWFSQFYVSVTTFLQYDTSNSSLFWKDSLHLTWNYLEEKKYPSTSIEKFFATRAETSWEASSLSWIQAEIRYNTNN